MPKAEFFSHFGIYVDRDFLDIGLCIQIYNEMLLKTYTKARIYSGVKEESRKVRQVDISEQTDSLIKDRLKALKPVLEDYFKVELTDFQEPTFLLYKQGDFYVPHTDNVDTDDAPDYVRKRKVSIVIFLNGQAETEEHISEELNLTYRGGELIFYELIEDSRAKHLGFPLEGESSLMVAFRSTLYHEVKPVTQGDRCTIVSWFY
jgi:SM-20-related protein